MVVVVVSTMAPPAGSSLMVVFVEVMAAHVPLGDVSAWPYQQQGEFVGHSCN